MWKNTCQALIEKGDHDSLQEAVRICKNILNENPEESDAQHLLAIILFKYRDLSSAEKIIDAAIKINRTNPSYYNTKGNILFHNRRYKKSLLNYRIAYDLSDGEETYLISIINTLIENQEYHQICKEIDNEGLEKLTKFQGLSIYGQALQLTGRYQESNMIFEKAIKALENTKNSKKALAATIQGISYNLMKMNEEYEATKKIIDAINIYDSIDVCDRMDPLLKRPPLSNKPQTPEEYHFVCVLWGERFFQYVLSDMLAVQLAPKNFSAMKRIKSKFYFYSPQEQFEKFKNHPLMEKLNEVSSVENIDITDFQAEARAYLRFTACHQIALDKAEKANAAVIPIFPDTIISDGYLDYVIDKMNQGKRAILHHAPRLLESSFRKTILDQGLRQPDGTLPLTPRQIVGWLRHHMHPITKSLFHDSKVVLRTAPYQILWDAKAHGDFGYACRAFLLVPICFYPECNGARVRPTYDFHYIWQCIENYDSIDIVTDSDHFIAIDPCPDSMFIDHYQIDSMDTDYGYLQSLFWIKTQTNPYHLMQFENTIWYHDCDLPKDLSAFSAEISNHAARYLQPDEELKHLRQTYS